MFRIVTEEPGFYVQYTTCGGPLRGPAIKASTANHGRLSKRFASLAEAEAAMSKFRDDYEALDSNNFIRLSIVNADCKTVLYATELGRQRLIEAMPIWPRKDYQQLPTPTHENGEYAYRLFWTIDDGFRDYLRRLYTAEDGEFIVPSASAPVTASQSQ